MKRILLKKYNSLITLLLALLGVGSSAVTCEDLTPGAEYGTPSATFRVNGSIKSEANAAIRNIRVIMESDTTYSDVNGAYRVEVIDFPDDQEFEMKFEDIDGAQNGSYQSYDTTAVFKNPHFTGGDGSWYEGVATKEIQIKLKAGN